MAQDEPLVWQGLTQRELDAAYDQAVYAPNLEQVVARQIANSHAVRELLGDPLRCDYGSGSNEAMDIYRAAADKAPIQVFVHGGTWQFGTAAENAFAAELFVNAGVHFLAVDFDSVTEHAGDLSTLVNQLIKAISWLYHNAEAFGGDRDSIYLSGFSSGAHLAGVLLTHHWKESGLPEDVIKGALLCSGMYDLRPVALSFRREYVSLNEDNIPLLSPIMHLDAFNMPVTVAVGTRETPEFQRQARDFVSALMSEGKEATLLLASECNHFEIIETLANPYGVLGRAVLQQMQLTPASGDS